MRTFSSVDPCSLAYVVLLCGCFMIIVSAADYNNDFQITWGGSHGQILDNGQLLTLSLDTSSGSGFESKNQYFFGKIDMQLKLVPGNSAGTVTSYYLSSEDFKSRDEIDFEFLGNVSGQPYKLHTNLFAQGKGEREQQFFLWFDPTADFHTYTILWNSHNIVFLVDGTPIRVYKNLESQGVPFPKNKPMKLYSSIWNAEEWATRGGLVKTDWSKAPFTASYRNFNVDAGEQWLSQSGLDADSQQKLKWVQNNYMIYNYCTDTNRFPQGFPPECNA